MVDIKELKVGDRIKIVDEPPKGSAFTICRDPHQTEMGQYLGKVVTVAMVQTRCVLIKQDRGRFAWTPELIEEKIDGRR